MQIRVVTSAGKARKAASPAAVLIAIVLVVVALPGLLIAGCESGSGDDSGGSTTSSTATPGPRSGDIEGHLGTAIKVGDALITVRALQSTFQPAMPVQRLSEQAPSAPAAGESFYQAYLRVENRGVSPIRVDPNDFACAVGGSIVPIEPTRSGPLPRSLLQNTSLDLILTFKAKAGFQPMLIYSPPWYDGTIRISPQLEATSTTT